MIGLTIYFVMFVVMFIGGVAYLRGQPKKIGPSSVYWMIVIALFWFLTIPLGLIVGTCQGLASLINEGKSK